jgi:hypothetical protein
MGRDYYAEARALAVRLNDVDHQSWSRALTDAIDEGATGTEILMRLRWQLDQLLASEVELKSDVRTEAKSLRNAIDCALT